ncbi:MAG TPA: glycosyltransferase [Candidatus Dormibacteraeota bacterium]|nr:glycosyltransferase [Candidatus Dormibacteraeota bacterium]
MSLLGRIRSLASRKLTDSRQSYVVGFRKFLAKGEAKKALLSYVTFPINESMLGRQPKHFSNHGIALAWVKILNQLGYEVDVINWDDTTWRPRKKYDLVIGHGGKNTTALLAAKKPEGKLIYFSTGSYWKFHNQAAKKRASYFFKRHKTRLEPDRQVTDSEEKICRTADGIITLGTKDIKDTYRGFPRVYNLEIGAYPINRSWQSKNFEQARNNFLFFAGGGNLHKGLDLLVDAFNGLEQHLYICTSLTPEFKINYPLTAPNIHYEGVVDLGGKRFSELVKKSAFVILPSCAEGSPGSVADCMAEGLIPVVTPQAGVWTGQYGFVVNDIEPAKITGLVKKLSGMDPQGLAKRSQAVWRHTTKEQSPEKFNELLKGYVKKIIETGKKS